MAPTRKEKLNRDLHVRLSAPEYVELGKRAAQNERTRPAEARLAIRAHLALDSRPSRRSP